LVTTDIGGDPDDQQSLIRLMVYANAFRLEGFVASAAGVPGELAVPIVRPDLVHAILDGYAKVLPLLEQHESGWPPAEDLRARVHPGNPQRGLSAIGSEHDTAGSNWIIARVDAATPEDPLNLSIWGGQTDFAQALWRVRENRGPRGLADFTRRLRVYDVMDQDGIADWIHDEFPGLFYILSRAAPGEDKRLATFRGMYLTGDETLTSAAWVQEHVLSASPLGALYPIRTWTAPNPHRCIKEGDTPSWFFFLPAGGNSPDDPTQPGWGGRFVLREDGRYSDPPPTDGDPRLNVSRWRPAFQADFARRMAWTRE
jgi:hypothetical protein